MDRWRERERLSGQHDSTFYSHWLVATKTRRFLCIFIFPYFILNKNAQANNFLRYILIYYNIFEGENALSFVRIAPTTRKSDDIEFTTFFSNRRVARK